jgi:branched-chain amino acid transport system permease protein
MIEQIIVNGIVAGSVYILAGLSFGIIFTTTGVFHFAHAAVYTFGGFGFYQMAIAWKMPFLLSFFAGIAFAGLLGVLIERVCYRPLDELQATPVQIFLTAVGLTIVLQNIALLIWKSEPLVVPISQELLQGRQLGSIRVTYFQIITIAVVAVLWGALHVFMGRSKMGKAIRAFAADPKTSELMGMDTKTLRLLIFLIGSALIALAAALQIMDFGMDTTTGLGVALLGFIATLIGAGWGLTGIGFISLALGIIENIGMVVLSSQWKQVILFGIIVLLLVIRPKGLFKTASR